MHQDLKFAFTLKLVKFPHFTLRFYEKKKPFIGGLYKES